MAIKNQKKPVEGLKEEADDWGSDDNDEWGDDSDEIESDSGDD